jgi:hypothetical protein
VLTGTWPAHLRDLNRWILFLCSRLRDKVCNSNLRTEELKENTLPQGKWKGFCRRSSNGTSEILSTVQGTSTCRWTAFSTPSGRAVSAAKLLTRYIHEIVEGFPSWSWVLFGSFPNSSTIRQQWMQRLTEMCSGTLICQARSRNKLFQRAQVPSFGSPTSAGTAEMLQGTWKDWPWNRIREGSLTRASEILSRTR